MDNGAFKQILVNVIGQAPLGYGIALLWPLVRKYGKRPVALVGFTIAAAGSLLVFFAGNDIKLVLVGLLVRSTGSLPTYTMMALLAEALDNIEKSQGFRPDGFSASFYSIIHTVMMGLGQTILLASINLFGYIAPPVHRPDHRPDHRPAGSRYRIFPVVLCWTSHRALRDLCGNHAALQTEYY